MARKMAKRFNINGYYTDLSELLLKEQVDIVHITTPPQTHLALSTQAMGADCHVLVEKPMALNLDEADRMIEAARSNKVRLCVVHNELFMPVVIRARSIIEKGIIGDLIGIIITDYIPGNSCLTQNREHWCHKLPGGIFGEMLPHPLYLAIAFLGRLEATTVFNRKLSSYDWLAADELRVILEGENSVATIIASITGSREITTLDIVGTKASLHISISNGVIIRYTGTRRDRLSHGFESIRIASQWLADTASAAICIISGRYHTGHYNLIKMFIESLQNDTELPVTIEESREVIRLYQAVTSQI